MISITHFITSLQRRFKYGLYGKEMQQVRIVMIVLINVSFQTFCLCHNRAVLSIQGDNCGRENNQ